MEYVLTLNNVYVSDENKVGQRAVDLAQLNRDHYNIPLCFVLNTQALEDFVEHNNLKEKGARFLAEGDHEALVRETRNGDFPSRMRAELREAYESLSVEGGEATDLVKGGEESYVTIFPSTNYPGSGNNKGIVQNANGLAELMNAIRETWAYLMSEEEFSWRSDIGIKEFFSGMIIMRMPESEAFIRAMSKRDEDHVKVQAGFGLPDFSDEIKTDNFGVSKDPLKIIHHEVNTQPKRIWRDENGRLELLPLEERGSRQKVNDKVIIEAARLTKKMANSLEEGMKAYYSVENEDDIKLLLADRVMPSEFREKEEDTTPLASPGSEDYHPEEVHDYYEEKEEDTEGVDDEDNVPQEEYTDVPEEDDEDSLSKHDMDEFETVPEDLGKGPEVDLEEPEDDIPLFDREEHEDSFDEDREEDEKDKEGEDDEKWSLPEIDVEGPGGKDDNEVDVSFKEEKTEEKEEDDEPAPSREETKEGVELPSPETGPGASTSEKNKSRVEEKVRPDERDEDDSLVSEFQYDEDTGESKEVTPDQDTVSLGEVMDKVQQGMEEAESVSKHVPERENDILSKDNEVEEKNVGELPATDPSVVDDDRLEHLESMKDMIDELDGLVKKGHHDEVHRKINRFEKKVQELRRKHKKKHPEA